MVEDKLNAQRYPFLTGGSRSVGLGSAPVRLVLALRLDYLLSIDYLL